MIELRMRNRTRLRRKEITELASRLQSEYGSPRMFTEEEPLESAELENVPVLVIGNEVVGVYHDGRAGLGVRGILKYGATKRFVTVDMGAVRFVTNGADIMGPGIVDADPELKAGQLCWIREERHGKPLAVGVAQADGPILKQKPKGKQIKNLHWVGDRLWIWGTEPAAPTPSPAAPDAPEE